MIKTKGCLLNGSFFNRVFKESIHKIMYGLAKTCNVTGQYSIVSGPDLNKHIEYCRENTQEEISIIEIDKNVHELQKNILNKSKHKNIKLIHNSVSNVESTHFMDIDLMATVIKCGPIIKDSLYKQMKLSGKKAFLFTVSIRNYGLIETIDWINDNILNNMEAKINDYNKVIEDKKNGYTYDNNGKTIYKTDENGNFLLSKNNKRLPIKIFPSYIAKLNVNLTKSNDSLIDIIMYEYKEDKDPMLTISIVYS